MSIAQTSFFLKARDNVGFVGHIIKNNFYLILGLDDNLSDEDGQKLLLQMQSEMESLAVKDLKSFEESLTHLIKSANLPSNFSLAAGFLNQGILYIKTNGQGQIYVFKNKKLTKIIEENISASGYVGDNDLFIFSTGDFIAGQQSENEMNKILSVGNLEELNSKLNLSFSALFVLFKSIENNDQRSSDISSLPQDQLEIPQEMHNKKLNLVSTIFKKISDLKEKISNYSGQKGMKRTYTFGLVVVLALILLWSVVLGYKRRSDAQVEKKINNAKELITQKLNQAQDVAFLNLPRSQALISEARQEVEKLKNEIGKKNAKKISELEDMIQSKENTITKKEEKKFEEFFDLTVDSKDAQGTKLYLEKDNLTILDAKRGLVYVLSLRKKSFDKKNATELKATIIIANYQGDILFYTKEGGVYKISTDGKVKKVIEKDKDWGEIDDMVIYNGSIYLMDIGKDEIYKYLVASDGYSGKNSYFQKGEAVSLKDASSIAIDSSLYIGFKEHAVKYTAGVRDEFKTDFPDGDVRLNKIFTNKDLDKVYAWDKMNGSIYILGKNGTYERQINSSVINKASDIVVFENNAYVLVGAKIYKVTVE